MPFSFVAIEIVGFPIIGDEEVELVIVVEVRPYRSQAEVMFRVVDPGFGSDLDKRAVAVVVIEGVG